MTVDTKRIRAYVEEFIEYAHRHNRERGLQETMGIKAGDLLALLDVYDRVQKAQTFSVSRVDACHRTEATSRDRDQRNWAYGERVGIRMIINIIDGNVDPKDL